MTRPKYPVGAHVTVIETKREGLVVELKKDDAQDIRRVRLAPGEEDWFGPEELKGFDPAEAMKEPGMIEFMNEEVVFAMRQFEGAVNNITRRQNQKLKEMAGIGSIGHTAALLGLAQWFFERVPSPDEQLFIEHLVPSVLELYRQMRNQASSEMPAIFTRH